MAQNVQRITPSFSDFDEMFAYIDRLRNGGYTQLGDWNLAMVEDHLARTMDMAMDGTMPWLPPPARWIARNVFIRPMIRKGRYPEIRFRAPIKMRPESTIDETQAHQRLLNAVAALKALPGPTLFTRAFGKLTCQEFIALQLLHAGRHLGFLKPNTL